MRSKLSLIQSVVSVEYAAPAVLVITALLVRHTRSHDSHMTPLPPAPSVSPLALCVAGGVCVWRTVQLRVAGVDTAQQGGGAEEAVCASHEREGPAAGESHKQQLRVSDAR